MKSKTRDDFPARIKQILGERSAYICSNPTCQKSTIGPHSKSCKSLKIGRAAHIKGAAPGGPRYDPKQSTKQRASIENGIWLCAACSDIVDKDESKYPSSLLNAWKLGAEAKTFDRLNQSIAPAPLNSIAANTKPKNYILKLLDEAFDILAGQPFATRITWKGLSKSKIERVRRILSDATSIDPSNSRLLLLKSLYYLAHGYPEKALSILNKIKAPKEAFNVKQATSCCYFQMGNKAKHAKLIVELSKNPKATASTFYNLGVIKLKSKNTKAAELLFRKAIKKDPNYPEAFDHLAQIYFDKKDYAKAISFSSQAYHLNPDDETIIVHYGLLLLESNQIKEAMEILEPSLSKYPGNPEILGYLGRAYAQLGNPVVAERYLRKALDFDPKDPIVLHNLANHLMFMRKFKESKKYFLKSLKCKHPYPEQIRNNLDILNIFTKKFKCVD